MVMEGHSRLLKYSRFLRARKFNLKDAKKMFTDCQEWRKTVEGIGIDELYRTLDPFDVSYHVWNKDIALITAMYTVP
jgi:hypothetical protein